MSFSVASVLGSKRDDFRDTQAGHFLRVFDAMERQATSYDELPYSSHPLAAGHPENLACKALLHGLRPAAVENCRLLELGCSTGGNLIPLGELLPNAEFVGLDHAARQIARGRAIVESLGLSNVDLRTLSFEEVDENLGTFDYIVCHGVYSWVSVENQQRILEIIRKLLRPAGVALVSYNVYPGWHLRGMVRDVLLRETAGRGDAQSQVQHARAYLDFLASAAPDAEGMLRQEANLLRRTPDTYVFHEHLETVNLPVYFRDFVGAADRHQLQYLGEASFSPMVANLPSEIRSRLEQLSRDRVDWEQQLDYLCCGTFRRSLLCHAGISVAARPLSHAIPLVRLAGHAQPASVDADLTSTDPLEFRTAEGAAVTTTHPLVKAALAELLDCWPRSSSFHELVERAAARIHRPVDPVRNLQENELLAAALLRCHECGLVDTHLIEPALATRVEERPRASRTARLQADQGESVSNLRHRIVDLHEVDRFLLAQLDGSRDLVRLAEELVSLVRQGALTLERNGQSVANHEELPEFVRRALQSSMKKMAVLALLESET
jgi:methyltransferase-like protein/2-polyprenyl-3-methyl-5-hydroxy-6-metoxy-1,4-benzoquinol methylase